MPDTVNTNSEQSFSVNASSTVTDTLHYVSNNENISVDGAGTITVKAGYVGNAEITITNVVNGEETSSKRITVTVTDNSESEDPFEDVSENDYYYKPVLWAVENGITEGTDQTHFAPNDIITRGQAVTLLYNYCQKPSHETSNPFEDVSEGTYYYDAVLWAAENNITAGTDENHFSPNDNCTRGQIVTFLYRALA